MQLKWLQPVLVFILLVSYLPSYAQQKKPLEIIQADRLNFRKTETGDEFNSLGGNVIVKQEGTTFYCDSAVINRRTNTLEAFGKIHINDADSIHTYSEYARYDGNTKLAYLSNNVRLTDGKGTLTTPELEYNVNSKIATYLQGGRVVNGSTVLTSREGTYYGDTKDVFFKGGVLLVDPEYTLSSDSLLYNVDSEIATFVTRTDIKSKDQRVVTSSGFYDLKNKRANFGKRPQIFDGTTSITADQVANDDKTGFGEANGNVILRDSAQGFIMYANNIKSNRNTNSLLATQSPVMAIKQDGDSLFIAADTLYTSRLTRLREFRTVPPVRERPLIDSSKVDTASDRFFEAYYNVRIFSDSLQAVGDSLFYSGEDSVFRLFKNPVVWAQGNQLSGDTIYLFTRHRKPELMRVFENGLAISQIKNYNYFNQVKGRTITGYFIDGNIDSLRAKGNAESIYYAEDDSAKLVGVNQSTADAIDVYFKNREPQKVALRTGVRGTSYPMGQVNHEQLRVRGFKWLGSRRPKSKADLFISTK